MSDLPPGYFPFPPTAAPRAFWRCLGCGLVRLEEHLPTHFGPRPCPRHRRDGEARFNMVRFEIIAAAPARIQPSKSGRLGLIYLRVGKSGSKLHIYSGHGDDSQLGVTPVSRCGRAGGEMLYERSPDPRDVCASCLRGADL